MNNSAPRLKFLCFDRCAGTMAEQFSSLRDGMREHEVEKILGARIMHDVFEQGTPTVSSAQSGSIDFRPTGLANDSQKHAIEFCLAPTAS